jgi:2Fe-2S ferredoxin
MSRNQKDRPHDERRAPVSVILGYGAGNLREIAAIEGERLLDALLRARAPIMSVCGGRACCGACRIRVDAAWRDRLIPAARSEARLLPRLHDPHENDRLSCQIELAAALSGLTVHIVPKEAKPPFETVQSTTGEIE